MITLKSIIDQIEVTRDGVVQVRMLKCFFDDGNIIGHPDPAYHRTIVEPGVSVDDQMAAVEMHLIGLGAPLDNQAGIERATLDSFVATAHTPAVIAKHQAEKIQS